MLKNLLHLLFILLSTNILAQGPSRPKLVVGIVVDQMRWDYLHRFSARYATNGGFKRMMNQGYNCENTSISYVPTLTACGHSAIYTGSVPSIHGITGNDWYDNELHAYVYCVSDKMANTVGSSTAAGKMSPRNLLSSTICQELKLATNFRSKTVAIALKDRGSILTVGHNADAAWWYDAATGSWITSDYYMEQLPPWVKAFNDRKPVDDYYRKGWNTLYPLSTYVQSATPGNSATNSGGRFPYSLSANEGVNYNAIITTPFGNTLTTEFAKANIENEKLGEDSLTDFLAISYSSPDLIGHAYGPNSIETEDCFLRLDAELGAFFTYLDNKIGEGEYLVFLSADHGVAHEPAFMKENNLPAGNIKPKDLVAALNDGLKKEVDHGNLVITFLNNQVVLDNRLMESLQTEERKKVTDWILHYLLKQDFVQHAFLLDDLQSALITPLQKQMIANGYYPKRSGQIFVIFQPQWILRSEVTGSTHGSWHPYDARIPLLWYGWKIRQGSTSREVSITDIAPTLAALLKIQPPNGSVGKVITEVIK